MMPDSSYSPRRVCLGLIRLAIYHLALGIQQPKFGRRLSGVEGEELTWSFVALILHIMPPEGRMAGCNAVLMLLQNKQFSARSTET